MSDGKNQILIWGIVIGVIVVVLIAFNFQWDKSDVMPLSEIFPDRETQVLPPTEYEFIPKSEPLTEIPPSPPTPPPAKGLAPATEPEPRPREAAIEPGRYTIQVLSSQDGVATQKALEKIKAKGHSASMVTKDLKERGTWYRIYVGSFATPQEAERYLPSLQSDFKDSYVILVK